MKPELVCHRGWWREPREQNTVKSALKALRKGHGVEIDVRFAGGELVMSHDHSSEEESDRLEELLLAAKEGKLLNDQKIFLDVKESGLGQRLAALLKKIPSANIAVFGNSVTDLVACSKLGIPCFWRWSVYEPQSAELAMLCAGVCVDLFDSEEVDPQIFGRLGEKEVLLISPELHGKNPANVWKTLRDSGDLPKVSLCCDRFAEAESFFSGTR